MYHVSHLSDGPSHLLESPRITCLTCQGSIYHMSRLSDGPSITCLTCLSVSHLLESPCFMCLTCQRVHGVPIRDTQSAVRCGCDRGWHVIGPAHSWWNHTLVDLRRHLKMLAQRRCCSHLLLLASMSRSWPFMITLAMVYKSSDTWLLTTVYISMCYMHLSHSTTIVFVCVLSLDLKSIFIAHDLLTVISTNLENDYCDKGGKGDN